MTRLQQHQAAGKTPYLPDPGPAAHLVAVLFGIGPLQPGAASASPLGHAEIAAWQANTGATLTAWESTTVRDLSILYAHTLRTAQDPAAASPAFPELTADRRAQVAQGIRALFGGMRA